MAMRWYARPENHPQQLRITPRLASWNAANDPDQVRLRAYLDDTEALLATTQIDGLRALRLDVGLPPTRDLLDAADLDNYAYPLTRRLNDPDLVSVWCTKQHSAQSYVRIDSAREVSAPASNVFTVTTSASWEFRAAQEQIHAAVADAPELPAGPVSLELSFVVGPRRNWVNLWKQTIDALDPLLGRTYPDRAWHPRDGRITELGMHRTVDHAAGNTITIAIAATAGQATASRPTVPPTTDIDQEPNNNGNQSHGPHEFRDDDQGYLSWLDNHPNGYVINIHHGHRPSTARLHHADCRTISGQNPRNGAWTRPYVKICAEQLVDLTQWAIDNVRNTIPPCGTCQPSSPR